MPLELELELGEVEPPELPLEELEDWAAGVDVERDELEEPDPHAASPRAAITSRTAITPRGLCVIAFVIWSSVVSRGFSRLRARRLGRRSCSPDASAASPPRSAQEEMTPGGVCFR